MPVEVFGKTYEDHDSAARAAADKGIDNPDAYVATIERKQQEAKSNTESLHAEELKRIAKLLGLEEVMGLEPGSLDELGQHNIIDYTSHEPFLYGGDRAIGGPGSILLNNEPSSRSPKPTDGFRPGIVLDKSTHSQVGDDMTQPNLPTGAPVTPINKLRTENDESMSIPAGLVEKSVATKKDFKEGGIGSGRKALAGFAQQISDKAPLIASQAAGLLSHAMTKKDDPIDGEYSYAEMREALIKSDIIKALKEAVLNQEAWSEGEHPRDEEGKFSSSGGTSESDVVSNLKLNADRIDTIKKSHLESKATYAMVDAGGYFEDNLPHLNSFEQFQTEEELFDMKEAIENGKYEKSDALFLKALKKQPKAFASFKEISEDLAGFNGALKEKTKNAKEIFRFTDTGELDSYLEKDATFGASHYAVGKDANYKCFTLEPFNKFFREGAEVVITTPTESFKENMEAAEYSSFPRSEAYGNKEAIDNEKSGRYALETEVRVRSETKVPVGKMKIEFLNHMSFNTVDKLKEKYSSLGELTFPNARSEFIDK